MEQIGKSVKPGKRALRCYEELIRFLDAHGFVPSYAELSERLGCSPSTVGRYLDQLQVAGLIVRKSRRARSIVIKVTSPRDSGDER